MIIIIVIVVGIIAINGKLLPLLWLLPCAGSDLVGASAAALAAAAVVFNASDHTYSTQLLATAESLYK